jgi:hypothetical protein
MKVNQKIKADNGKEKNRVEKIEMQNHTLFQENGAS